MSYRMRGEPLMLSLFLTLHATAQWTPLNGPHGAAVTCFAHSPTAVLACTYQGVYRSTDSGLNWALTSSGLATPYPLATAATYHDNKFHVGDVNGRVYSSTDDGLTWTLTYDSGLGASIDAIVGNGSTLLVAESLGLARSSDGGQTFVGVTGLLDTIYVTDLAVCGSTLFAGTTAYGLKRSDDGGVTWQQVELPVADSDSLYIMSLAAEGPLMVVNTFGWVYYSSDFGQTFQSTGSGIESTEPLCFHFDGTDLICGSRDGIYLSTDLGESYGSVLLEDGTWTEAYLVHDGIHLAGSLSKGIQRSTNAGAAWTGANDDIHAWSVEHLTNDGQYLYAGSLRNGAHRYDPLTQTWTGLCSEMDEYGHYVWELATVGPNLILCLSTDILHSPDHGANWSQASGPTPAHDLVQDGDSSYLFASNFYGGIFTTTDNGENWTVLPSAPYNTNTALLAHGYFYINRSGPLGVERSVDGIVWEVVLPDSSFITAMASDGATVYVGDSAGLVRATQDHGDTWTALEPVNEPAPWINTLSVCNGLLTMSTREALYRYVPGTGWESINEGLEGLQVLSQLCDGTGITVGTDAGGVFRQDLFEAVPEQDRTIGFQCFPNPTTGLLNIQTTGVHGRVDLEVLNAVGQVVHRSAGPVSTNGITISLDVPDGCYAVHLSADGQVVQQRVQVVR